MKIFEMNDCEWYAGESVEDCIEAFVKDNGEELEFWEECRDEGYPKLLSEKEMQDLNFLEDPYDSECPKRSFKDELNRMIERGDKFPCFFATTEY